MPYKEIDRVEYGISFITSGPGVPRIDRASGESVKVNFLKEIIVK